MNGVIKMYLKLGMLDFLNNEGYFAMMQFPLEVKKLFSRSFFNLLMGSNCAVVVCFLTEVFWIAFQSKGFGILGGKNNNNKKTLILSLYKT